MLANRRRRWTTAVEAWCLNDLARRLVRTGGSRPDPFVPAWWRTLIAWWSEARFALLVQTFKGMMLLGMALTLPNLVSDVLPPLQRWGHLDPRPWSSPGWTFVAWAALLGWCHDVLLRSTFPLNVRPFPTPATPGPALFRPSWRARAAGALLKAVRFAGRHLPALTVLLVLWRQPLEAWGVPCPRPQPVNLLFVVHLGSLWVPIPPGDVLVPFVIALGLVASGCAKAGQGLLHGGRALLALPQTVADQIRRGHAHRQTHYQDQDTLAHRLCEQALLARTVTEVLQAEAPPLELQRPRRRL